MKRRSIIEINDGVVQISKCGRYIACGCGNALKIIDSNSADVISTFSCSDTIKAVDWHFQSDRVLSVADKVSAVEAFSLSDPEWMCRIEVGDLGLKSSIWGPKGHYILTLAEFGVRISVWSLKNESVCYIDNPILKRDEITFSKDGNYFACIIGPLERYNITIYCTVTWNIVQEIECTHKIVIPSPPLWSPTNLHLVIGEVMDLNCAFLEVYSLGKRKPYGMFKQSRGLCRISMMVWAPTGQFLLVGCHDEKVYVLNYVTWGVIAELCHSAVVTDSCEVYAEERNRDEFEAVDKRPVTMSKVKKGVLPGVIRLTCDSTGVYIASQCSSMPAVVFIWEIGTFFLKTVIAFHAVVIDIKWNPTESKLMACSGSRRVTVWSGESPDHIKYSSTNTGLRFVRGCFWCPGSNNFSVVGSSSLYILHSDNA